MTDQKQPQPAASSAVEQAKEDFISELWAILGPQMPWQSKTFREAIRENDVIDQALNRLVTAVRAEFCPACAEKDQQLANLEHAFSERIAKDLDHYAGKLAKKALRDVLKRQPQTAPHQDAGTPEGQ